MRRTAMAVGVLVLAGTATAQDAPKADGPAPVELGEPTRDKEIEIRVPKGAESKGSDGPFRYQWDYQPPGAGPGGIFVLVGEREVSVAESLDLFKQVFAQTGAQLLDERKTFDPKTGSLAALTFAMKVKGGAEGMGEFYLYGVPGHLVLVGTGYGREDATEWRRIGRAVLYSFRLTWVPDDRLATPDGERTETPDFELIAAKGVAAATVKQVAAEFAQAFALARGVTGEVAGGVRPRIHLFGDTAKMENVASSSKTNLPWAVYMPEGRCILALAARGAPGQTLADRCEAAARAWMDRVMGTPFGVPPWLEGGLREFARGAKKKGEALECDLGKAPIGGWLRGKGKKASYIPLRAFMQAPGTEFIPENPERLGYALGLVATLAKAADERQKTLVPRFLADFRRHRDPDLALDDALKGMDLDALDAAVKTTLGR